MHEGHRKRMLERLANAENSLQMHEFLEILLYNAIPRKNTNEIAHNLLDAFGDLNGIFHAEISALMSVDGVGENTAAYLKLFGTCLERYDTVIHPDLPSAYSYESFSKFLIERFHSAKKEFVELYGVKESGEVSFCQRFTSDQSDKVQIPAAEVLKFMADVNAPKVILVHNHLNNQYCYPSEEDDAFTKELFLRCSVNRIKLVDHFIVCPDSVYSYFLKGKMQQIAETYDIERILGVKR